MFGYVFDFKEKEECDHPFDTEKIISGLKECSAMYAVHHVLVAGSLDEKRKFLEQVRADFLADAKDVVVSEGKLYIELSWDNLYTALNTMEDDMDVWVVSSSGHLMTAGQYLAYLLYVHKKQGKIELELSNAMAFEYLKA